MNSHDIARQLLARPSAPLVIQAGHQMAEGDIANELMDISHNLDGELCLEVGEAETIAAEIARMS